MTATLEPEDMRQARRAAYASMLLRRGPRGSGATYRDIANIDRWREDNPDAFKFWTTTYGYVVATRGERFYTGICQTCGGMVTDRKAMVYRPGGLGRWPKNCAECKERKNREHQNGAKERMRRVRGPATGEYRVELLNRFALLNDEPPPIHPDEQRVTERFYRLCRERGMKDPE